MLPTKLFETRNSNKVVIISDPCLTLISGNGGEVLLDGIKDQCTVVPWSVDGLAVHYELAVGSRCGTRNDVTVKVKMDLNADCDDLVSALSVKEGDDDCGRNSMKMNRCSMVESVVDSDRRVCRSRCKCTDSADSCLLQIYSRGWISNNPEIKICEVEIEIP